MRGSGSNRDGGVVQGATEAALIECEADVELSISCASVAMS